MIPDEVELMQLVSSGEKLARVDDVDYLAVHVVFAWPRDGAPAVYCHRSDWPASIAARLAAKETELAELAEAFALQAAEALKQAQRAEAAERRIAELERLICETPIAPAAPPRVAALSNRERVAASPDGLASCDVCDWRGHPRGLGPHKRNKHGIAGAIGHKPSKKSAPAASKPPASPIALVESPWRCESCGSDTHTRSLSNPARCMRCAADAMSSHANGHLAAA